VRLASAQCPDGTPPPCGRPTARPAAAPAANSVAVLYFENLSRDTAEAYVADGLTEEVTARLGQVGRLVVAPRAAVRRLRATAATLPLAQLGRTLNAAYLVSGSTRSAGSRVRVTVELIRAATGARVWGEQYDRENTDLLALQEDIAQAVATGIAGRLLPAERRSLATRPTESPVAYDHYLRGNRMLWNSAESSLRGAIAEYEAALGQDPRFTAALGRLAYAYGLAGNWAFRPYDLPADSVLARGEAAADRALAEDSTVADAWLGRGMVLIVRGRPGDPEQALEAMRRAVTLDPGSDAALHNYATVLRRLGHFDEAEAALRRVLAVNPAYLQSVSDLGFLDFSRRRYAAALTWYDSAVAIDTTVAATHSERARARAVLGDLRGAAADAAAGVRLARGGVRPRALAVAAELLARAGDTAAARQRFQDALREAGWADGVPATIGVRGMYEFALAAIALGERDLALTILEHVRPRGPWLWSYLVWEGFDPIRADPRFQAVYREARPAGAPDPP
jgi:TolB-like protein/Tfp pilus assembly protein PilF